MSTLRERIARWREIAESENSEYTALAWQSALQSYLSELEADLRELREIVELVPHKQHTVWKDGIDLEVCWPDCPRCALEARIGQAKELRQHGRLLSETECQ